MAVVKKPQFLSSLRLAGQYIAEPVSLNVGPTVQENLSLTSDLMRRILGQGGELVSPAERKRYPPAFSASNWIVLSDSPERRMVPSEA